MTVVSSTRALKPIATVPAALALSLCLISTAVFAQASTPSTQPMGVIPVPKPEVMAAPTVPTTAKKAVTNTYHGTTVIDEYQWLENDKDPARAAWLKAQNALSRQSFDGNPMRAAIKQRVAQLLETQSLTYSGFVAAGGKLFAMKRDPKRQQPLLVMMDSNANPTSERTVFDPGAQKATVAIDFFEPSHDGKTIALVTSDKGSEVGSLSFIKQDGTPATTEIIPRVQYPTGGGSVAWASDNRTVYYTRYPAPGERPEPDMQFFQQVYVHTLGQDPSKDRYEVGKDFPRIAEIALSSSDNGRTILATVANGDGGDYAHYVKHSTGKTALANAPWQQISKFEDQLKAANFGADNALYVLSRKDAPLGKIVRMTLGQNAQATVASARVVVAQEQGAITGFEQLGSRIWVEELIGGPSQLRGVALPRGKKNQTVPDVVAKLPEVASVSSMLRNGQNIMVRMGSYTSAAGWFNVTPSDASLQALPINVPMTIDMSDAQVTREFATSKDGTRVPINIVSKKGVALNGNNPVMLTGYGGYGVSQSPRFNPLLRMWLDAGGVWVEANLRGGGEFGEPWHLQGNLTKKQNVFDDFVGAAEHVIKRGYTQPSKLVITGGSNGGLLMGAAFTQRPDLFAAVVSWVGIYDMLRVELEPNGVFNITEFGTVADKAQFNALRAYSPYHQVKDGTRYPSILFVTGENDGRVAPWQSMKMTARLQQAAPKDARQVLLRTDANAGHGMGTALSARIEEMTDAYSFIFSALGMTKL